MENQNTSPNISPTITPEAVPTPTSDPKDFSAPTAPLIPSDESKKKKPLLALWIVLAVAVLGVGGYFAYKYLMKKPVEEPEKVATAEEIAESASKVYFAAEDAIKENKGETEIIEAMDNVIASAPESQKKNLNIFEFFLMARHELSGAAMMKYYEVMNVKDTNPWDYCAIFDTRALLARFEGNDEEAEEYRNKMSFNCSGLGSRIPKKEDETDYEYAERLYLNGYISFAKDEFEKIDYSTLDDDWKLFAYSVRGDYYRLNRETEKYQEMLTRFLEIAQPNEESEE